MRQLGAIMCILALMPVLLAGCSDDTQEVSPTGIKIGFTDCLTVGIWVFVNGDYIGMASSEEPTFFELAPGTYELYMRTNAYLGDIFGCWNDQVSVSEGNTSTLFYSCDGAECQDPPEE
jgi:hypothetical protein